METCSTGVFSEFIQANQNYISHLQQISILLITATSIIFYNNKNEKWPFLATAGCSFVFGVVNLIIGLHLYSLILETILDFTTSCPQLPSPDEIRFWITIQFWFDVFLLSLIVFSVLLLTKSKRGVTNE